MNDLRLKLGMAGYHLWTLLVRSRRADGLVTLSVAEMRRARGLTEDQAKKGLARLAEAKLLRSLGWRRLEVEGPFGELAEARRFVRQVRGEILDPLTARVPVTSWRWLRSAKGWGGARAGAGRPSARDIQEAPSPVFKRPPAGGFGVSPTGTPFGGCSSIIPQNPPLDLPSVDPKETGRDRDPFIDSISGLDLGDQSSQAPDLSDDRPRHITAQDLYRHPDVPARPRIRTPVIPPPPLLDPSATPLEQAKILARLYTTALERRYSKRIWTFSKGVERSRYRKLLESIASVLVEKEIPPGQWVKFRLESVLDRTRNWQSKPPPVNTIFSKKAIGQDRWKYRAFGEDATLVAHRVSMGKAQRSLVRRYGRMELALLHEVPLRGLEAVPAIVGRFFPPGVYDQLVEAAQAESVELTRSLRQRAAAGEYLW